MTSPIIHIDLDSDDETRQGPGEEADGTVKPALKKKLHILSQAPAVMLSITDSIKPKNHGNYMESDDPTHISNVRRSLIEQEFPNSTMPQMSTVNLKNSISGSSNGRRTLSREEYGSGLLDESVNLLPEQAVQDYGSSTGVRDVPNSKSEHIKRRFLGQHRKSIKRHLDHSEFTSEEDLPYQGDSDLSLPLEILFRVALYINQAKAAEKIESTLVSVTTSSIDILVNSLTAFERIVHTPIPKAYNIHL